MKKFIQRYGFEILIIIAFSLLPLFWLHNGEVVLGHDANYYVNHSERMISSMFSWNDTNYYGGDWTYDRGYLPINLIQLFFSKLTPSFSMRQSIFFVFIFLLLGLGLYTLTLNVFPAKKYRPLRLIASVYSMFNFFILQGWFTADTGRFLVFTGLPFFILVIHCLFTYTWSIKKSLIVFAVLSFFFNGNGLPPLVGFQAVAIGIIWVFYSIYSIKQYHWKGAWFSLKTALFFVLIFIIINAYWLLPILNFTSVSYTSSFSSSGGVEGTLDWEKMISKYASFSNLFRLQGIADWYDNTDHAYSQSYISNPLLIVISFIPILTIFIGLYSGRIKQALPLQKRLLNLFLLLWFFGLFMSSGTHPPFGKIYELCMRYIPGFVIFRSSLYKFGFSLWVPMIFLFAYFSNEFISRIAKNTVIKVLLAGLVLVGIVGFHYPYFFPDKVFHFNKVFKTRFILPTYVTEMVSYIDREVPLSSRILLLPELDREYIGIPMDAYSWGYYSIIMLPNFISNHTYIADEESDTIIQMIYRSIYSGDVSTFDRLVRKTSISYVLFRRDVQLSIGTEKLHPIGDVEKRLQSIPSVHLQKEFGDWLLYSISSSRDVSMVTTVKTFDMLLPQTTNSTYLMARNVDDNHGVVRVFSDETKTTLRQSANKEIIEAECYFCKKDEYIQLVKSINLPIKRTLPSFIRTFISTRKEKQNIALTIGNPKERIDVDLALSQQILADIISTDVTEKQTVQTLRSRYNTYILDITKNLTYIFGRDKNIYITRVKAYLEAQLRTISLLPDLEEEQRLITGIVQKLEQEAWYTTDIGHLRFGFTVSTEGTYQFYLPDAHLYATKVLLDGRYTSFLQGAYLTEGFHKVEVERINMDISIFNGPPALFIERSLGGKSMGSPEIVYERLNPTEYVIHISKSVDPFILELNQRYDPRWKAYIKNQSSNNASTFLQTLGLPQISDSDHVEINGYANGWYVSSKGDFDIILSYWPQRIFYVGLIISGFGIVSLFIIISYIMYKRNI